MKMAFFKPNKIYITLSMNRPYIIIKLTPETLELTLQQIKPQYHYIHTQVIRIAQDMLQVTFFGTNKYSTSTNRRNIKLNSKG